MRGLVYHPSANGTQGDIISLYLFGKSLDLISQPDFLERADQMRSFTKGAWFSMHFPFIRSMMLKAPHWILAIVNNAWVNVFIFCEDLAKKAIVQFDQENGSVAKESDSETIFERLLHANVRRQEKGKKAKPLNYHELADEGISSLNAGTEPTATMLAYATYFFLRYVEVQDKIMEELATVQLDHKGRLPLQQIESLPYFVRKPASLILALENSSLLTPYRPLSSRNLSVSWFLSLVACHVWYQKAVFMYLQSTTRSPRAPW